MATLSQNKNIEEISDSFEEFINRSGEQELLETIVDGSDDLVVKDINLEIPIIEMADKFFELHRQTNKEIHFVIGKVLRKAAHIVYRKALKQHNKKKPNSKRFLTAIK